MAFYVLFKTIYFVNRITNNKKKNNKVSLLSPNRSQLSNNTINNKKNINSVEQSQFSKKQDILQPPNYIKFQYIIRKITKMVIAFNIFNIWALI